ncbi:N-acetylmuramoyl-L-alanine amidase CwlA [Bacilli bacterium PM5-3]|nr:N-acetylmuramoyl-L-alanine amidase CwlA [Bacilli bacterium PM5-3]
MKKSFFSLIVFSILTSVNINASNIYEPIGKNVDFETHNKIKYGDPNFIKVKSTITNDEIIEYAKAPSDIKYQYNRLAKITNTYKYMRYNTSNLSPKGVVVHATAGGAKDNINNEISYMSNNWKNAFVHNFSDDDEIIEVHNPQYAAWGAGTKANPYYIHTELVETSNRNLFMKSINNQAYYVAIKLHQFNLKPSRATSKKTGTVWFHSEVTKYLGGTNHSDPTGYYSSHGYSLSKFYNLVVYHYNNIANEWTTNTINTDDSKTVETYYQDILREKTIYSYDESKNVIKKNVYYYSTENKLLLNRIYQYIDNNISNVTEVHYHEKGYRISYVSKTYQNKIITYKQTNEYDAKGKLKSVIRYYRSSNNKLTRKYRINYKTNSHKKNYINYLYTNGKVRLRYEYIYNNQSKLVSKKSLGNAYRYKTIYKNGVAKKTYRLKYKSNGKKGKSIVVRKRTGF